MKLKMEFSSNIVQALFCQQYNNLIIFFVGYCSIYNILIMKKKALQTLIFLNSRLTPKLDSNTIHETINSIPKSNINDINNNAKHYAATQLQSNYGIQLQQPLNNQQEKAAEEIISKINQLKKMKSIRLASIIEKMDKKMNYQQLQEARQFLLCLNKKQVKQLSFTLEVLQKVIKNNLQKSAQYAQNHTIASAMSLIQQLKQAKRIDEV